MGTQVVSRELTVKEEHAPRAVSIIDVISRAAQDPTIDVEKMVKLVELHERIQAREAKIEYSNAMARLAMKMPRITRSGVVAYEDKNMKGKMVEAFRFARYEDIDRVIRPLLSGEGFSLSFKAEPREGTGGGIVVTGTLNHIGGHSESASIPVALDTSGGKNNIQAMGSSFSYGKRYTATMLLNIVTEGEDNDAQIHAEFIGEREAQQIRDLFLAANMDEASKERFLGVAKAESVEKILARDYARLLEQLEKKARAKR